MDNNDNLIKLSDLKPGDRCIVKKIQGWDNVIRRIYEIGIRPGVIIFIERVAPLGDPVEFKIDGFHVSLRKEESERVLVEVIDE